MNKPIQINFTLEDWWIYCARDEYEDEEEANYRETLDMCDEYQDRLISWEK